MDINNFYQPNNNLSARGSAKEDIGYDLKTEKQEMEEITKETKQELLEKWQKAYANAEIFPARIAAMHPGVVDFLLGFDLVGVYDNIAREANLKEDVRNILPQVVWQVAQEKKWDGVEQILQSKIALDPKNKTRILLLLEQDIIGKIRAISEKPFVKKENFAVAAAQRIKLPLAKALEQYRKLGEQGLTTNPLKLKYFETPVRPSIKNWITDFHDNMGAGKHGAIDRGNYLYHSENGKKLTPLERQKLSSILKSLDENSPLTIDPEKQIVILENNKNSIAGNQQTAYDGNAQQDIFERYTPAEGKGFFSTSRTGKTPEKIVNSPASGQKNYFQAGIEKLKHESSDFFSNFSSKEVKKAPLPEHTIESFPAAASPRNIDAVPNPTKTEDALSLNGNIRFSSAQNFSKERKTMPESQWHIKPTESFNTGSDAIEDKLNQAMKNSKNIVNLKE